MPDTARIDKFNCGPYAEHYSAAPEDGEAKEASTKDAEATPAEQDLTPAVDL